MIQIIAQITLGILVIIVTQYVTVRLVLARDFILCLDIDFKHAILDDSHLDNSVKESMQLLYDNDKPSLQQVFVAGTLSRKRYYSKEQIALYFSPYSKESKRTHASLTKVAPKQDKKTNRRYHLHRHMRKLGVGFDPETLTIFIESDNQLQNTHVLELIRDHKYQVQYEIAK